MEKEIEIYLLNQKAPYYQALLCFQKPKLFQGSKKKSKVVKWCEKTPGKINELHFIVIYFFSFQRKVNSHELLQSFF